jgi:hypothetical protein
VQSLGLAAGPTLLADAGKGIPDFSSTERSKVPEAFKARVSDLYPSPAVWRTELAAVQAKLPGLDPLAQGWTHTPMAMADLFERRDGFLQAGSSKFPLETLREAGVDFTTPKPVEDALMAFDGLVGEMEELYDRIGTGGA